MDDTIRPRVGNNQLIDASLAGSPQAHECTLILAQGDQAKALATLGRDMLDPARIGVLLLRGKVPNARDTSFEEIRQDEEARKLEYSLGLEYGKTYTNTRGFRYGHLMLMADRGYDGSLFKGLLINFLAVMAPSLLQIPGFLHDFITPVVKVWQGSNHKRPLKMESFLDLPQYEEWKVANIDDISSWHSKHFRGLDAISSEDAQIWFSNLDRHLKDFAVMQAGEAELFDLAFSKDKTNKRKFWLNSFIPGLYIDHKRRVITYSDFVNKELILFHRAEAVRSIPAVMDGLRAIERKILHTSFQRNLTTQETVAELADHVSVQTCYPQKIALQQSIVELTQTYAGSNNINYLEPGGNVGSRLAGGSDAADSCYIYTRLSPFARNIFSILDEPILQQQEEDGKGIEPAEYIPILPMILINGTDGTGTEWSTSIPNYHPVEVVANLKRRMGRLDDFADDEEAPFESMTPWFRNWNGNIELAGPASYRVNGVIEWDESVPEEVIITELPLQIWTDDFKTSLDEMISYGRGSTIVKGYKDFSDHCTVRFVIRLEETYARRTTIEALRELFGLDKKIVTSEMVALNTQGKIHTYRNTEELLEEYYSFRLDAYKKRKRYWLRVYNNEYRKLKSQSRFIQEIIEKKLVIGGKEKGVLLEEIGAKNYESFPRADSNVEDSELASCKNSTASENSSTSDKDSRDYEYLLSMPIWSLTRERLEELEQQVRKAKKRHDDLDALSEKDIWCRELDDFLAEWQAQFVVEDTKV